MTTETDWKKEVQLVRPRSIERAKQDIDAYFGINEVSTDTKGLSMLVTMLEPGGNSNSHLHLDSETGLYVVSGTFASSMERPLNTRW